MVDGRADVVIRPSWWILVWTSSLWMLPPGLAVALGAAIGRGPGFLIGSAVGLAWFVMFLVGLSRTRVVAAGPTVTIHNMYRTHIVDRPARVVRRPIRWGLKPFDAACVPGPDGSLVRIWVTFGGEHHTEIERIFRRYK